MTVGLLLPKEVQALLRERLNSFRWWMIVAASPMGMTIASTVEREFYAGDAGKDFDLLICGPVALYLAAKSRMNESQLANLLPGVIVKKGLDVIIPADTPIPILAWLIEFVGPDIRPA